ncbi:MAG: tetratricopeptide repeat protein [Pseudomonadota bacterium]
MKKHLQVRTLMLMGGWLLGAVATGALAQPLPPVCGQLENAYGPFDYTNPVHVREKLNRVERFHFDRNTELLIRGRTGTDPIGDLDYTLRAFPNHHRALMSTLNYAKRYTSHRKPARANFPLHCYFRRAVAWAPQDGIARAVLALYLEHTGETEEALSQFARAVELVPQNAEAHYNYGLMLIRHKDYETALVHAKRAYELGHPLPGLRNLLERAGAWTEDEPSDQASEQDNER